LKDVAHQQAATKLWNTTRSCRGIYW